jgi:hypothetical protein
MGLSPWFVEPFYSIKAAVTFCDHFALIGISAEPVQEGTQFLDIRFKSVRVNKAVDQARLFPEDFAGFCFPAAIGRRQCGRAATAIS